VVVLAYLREHPCVDCGEVDPVVLEFDHLGDKRDAVGALASEGHGERVLLAEIAKCEVVCVNCHRRRTVARRGRCPPSSRARSRNRAFVQEWLRRHPCADCAEADPVVLEFDHVDTKRAPVSTLVRGECSLEVIADEIARCVVRCANCHRRRTAARAGHHRHVAALSSEPPS
jgi:hypothetical protein